MIKDARPRNIISGILSGLAVGSVSFLMGHWLNNIQGEISAEYDKLKDK